MTYDDARKFLKVWQGMIVSNRFGVKARVEGLSPNYKEVFLTIVKDTQGHGREGKTGNCPPRAIGSLWK